MSDEYCKISRGTTPKHTFCLPVGKTRLAAMTLTYSQKKRNIIIKSLDDFTFSDAVASVTLSQEETLLFAEDSPVEIQMRLRLSDGNSVINSNILSVPVDEVLQEEVI
ncbi:MAG: hypothetical protein RR235_04990 [Oscillospiraceae bacterium]